MSLPRAALRPALSLAATPIPPLAPALGLALGLTLGLALPAGAQSTAAKDRAGKVSLLEFLDPDRIAARVLQMGIAGLRTQADIVYGTLSTSVTGGSATITDLTIWPMVDWDVEDSCEIRIDRLRLSTAPLMDLDRARLRLHMTGATVTADCLPPDARGPVLPVTGEKLAISRALVDIDYRIPSSSAVVQIQLSVTDQAAIGAVIDMDYVWLDASQQYRDPIPVVFLNSARVTLDNLGLWQKVQPMLPPMLTDAAQFGPLIDQGLSGLDPFAQTPSKQRGLLGDSIKVAFSEFLADPKRLVLETSFSDGPRLLDIEAWGDSGPDVMLDDLEPRLVTQSTTVRALPPAQLVAKGYDAPASLSREEALRIGAALATGAGAPRDPGQAQLILGPLATGGDGEAALILARALEGRDPAAAYGYALLAARSATEGAAGILDRVEAALPLARVLELQHERVANEDLPVESLGSLTSIRDEAAMSLSGKGRSRSYQLAVLWASIGAAAGDAESADILAEVDALIAGGDAAAQAVWAGHEAYSVSLARSAWLDFDLPASFGAGRQ